MSARAGRPRSALRSAAARARGRLVASPLIPGRLRERSGRLGGSSLDYRVVGTDDSARALVARYTGWGEAAVAQRQSQAWNAVLSADGPSRVDVSNLTSALEALAHSASTLVEVGCGAAYNATVVARAAAHLRYVGLDLSEASLALARHSLPATPLVLSDSGALALRAQSVDVVLDGAALMHTPQWEASVREQCRVAREAVILHTVTVCDSGPTTVLTKRAYGHVVPELVLARDALEDAISSCGFAVVTSVPGLEYDLTHVIGRPTSSETWLCRRRQ